MIHGDLGNEKVGCGLDKVKITFGDVTTVYMTFSALIRLLRDGTVVTWVKEECWCISYCMKKKTRCRILLQSI